MLTIYSASAGTGKTHTLTGEYLSLLFKGREQRRRILAVTFTNKATAEMKNRIVEELFRLADNRPSCYIAMLSDNGKKDETIVRKQAKEILINILHDYSALNISTIDHFFQQTIRAFTREIGLQGNYQIELNENLMMEESVENMLSELEKSENAALMNWLLRFTENKIEEGGGWDIRRDIIKLGGQLFKETYKSYHHEIREELQQKEFLSDYQNDLSKIIQQARQTAKEFGIKGISLIKQHGMQPTDFKNGSRSAFLYFNKLVKGIMDAPSATFRGLVDNIDGYLAKTATPAHREAAAHIYGEGMNDLIRDIVSFFDNLAGYYTAHEINRNFYALGILADLSQHIAAWREEKNKLLIADTTELLNKVIDGNEIPFIYEKTGTRIEHYMIDEFQDTSGMQWANFRPLLKDSLDYGRSNLIVGDIKQSIYRFRNSDWTLLDYQVKQDFPQQITEKKLDVNWRSCRHIVEFNNMLFEQIPAILQNSYNEEIEQSSLPDDEKKQFGARIISAYANSLQHVSKPFTDKNGHVHIRFLEDTDEKKWQELSLEQLPRIVEQLQDNGYELRDIAILTRTGREGALAADTLLTYKEAHPESNYKYDIISEDSLTVGSSLSVRWFIAMLRYLHQPDITSNYQKALAAYVVLRRKKHSSHAKGQKDAENESSNDSVLQNDRDRSASQDSRNLFHPFPPETMAIIKNLSNRPLYEIAEGLLRLFKDDFPDNELIFIQAFLDTIVEFSTNETADIGQFISWWDETGVRKKIVTPDSQNAIRIMTIHKAKGLGVKAVIIPFAEWKLDQKEAILWCHPSKKPFNKISLVPVKYSLTLKNTFFAADYFHEKLHAYMDNLNILYVAFTRAKEELIVIAPKHERGATSISQLLWKGLQADTQHPLDCEAGIYERGTWWHTATKSEETPEIEELHVGHLYSVSPDKRIQLRLQHRKSGFFEEEKRKYGLLMHDILSLVEKREDIDSAISIKYLSGEITRDEADILKDRLTGLIGIEQVEKWFDGSMQVLMETDILFGKGQSRRPDRIMKDNSDNVTVVDYKFGGKKESSHHSQVKKYISLIRDMGYRHVDGYLWYISLNDIEKCIF
ncbi:MAG: UvrD-helicase domain-containing protein [Tannerella sp.]|jgi:ATP-dependent exoDNAse (exonuclease V) beta subunit|nr:UvrD-helicase domain-containing protein [Tannerella sp.]